MKYIILILSLLLLVQCTKPTEDPTTGSIEGTVFNFNTGGFIGGAHIVTTPPTSAVLSDTLAGMYKIEHVDPGVYRITAVKYGFDTSSVSVSVIAGNITTADITLKPDTSFTDTLQAVFQE